MRLHISGQEPEASGQEPEASGQEPEARGQRPAARGQEPEARGQRRGAPRIWLLVALLVLSAPLLAQRGGRIRGPEFLSSALGGNEDFYTPPDWHGNPPYDGRVTFARLKYRGYGYWAGRQGPGWSHDYPDADVHFMKIMREISSTRPFVNFGQMLGGAIVAMDDPALLKYPFAYLSEPGGWFPNENEVRGLSAYLKKGGFLMADDFPPEAWGLWQQNMAKILPGLNPVQMTGKETIFDSFFKVDMEKIDRGFFGGGRGAQAFFAYYEDNDPKKRIIVLACYNHDIGESWEWSGTGFMAVDVTNEAFKLGVNILIYALTH